MDALSLAANIVQFVDFSSKLVSKGYRVYRSADSILPYNFEMEAIVRDLPQLTTRLRSRTDLGSRSKSTKAELALEALAKRCDKIAVVLLDWLARLKVCIRSRSSIN